MWLFRRGILDELVAPGCREMKWLEDPTAVANITDELMGLMLILFEDKAMPPQKGGGFFSELLAGHHGILLAQPDQYVKVLIP